MRRLQEYERFKQAALNLDLLPRLERDTWLASAEFNDRRVVRVLPEVTLREMLLAFKDVAIRSEMFAHHHIHREPLSVRARMSDILASLKANEFIEFSQLFLPEDGRMGVAVTFISILELLREGAAGGGAERTVCAHSCVRGGSAARGAAGDRQHCRRGIGSRRPAAGRHPGHCRR